MVGGFSDYDDAARRALADAQAAAEARGHTWIGTEHLLLGLVPGPETDAAARLAGLGVSHQRIAGEIDRVLDLLVDREKPTAGGGLTARSRKVLDVAEMEARRDRTAVSPEHLLRAIVGEGEGLAARVLASLGVTVDALPFASGRRQMRTP